MSRPVCLDLFCGAGGASMGLYRAGFDVVGVDIKPQPQYPAFHDADYARHFRFIQADAMTFPLDGYDCYWASPSCQAYCALRHLPNCQGKEYPDLIRPVRERLKKAGRPYTIENVPNAPLHPTLMLCGSTFDLRVRRHRLFEVSFPFPLPGPPCFHRTQGAPIDVSGTGAKRKTRRKDDHGGSCNKPSNLAEARAAIGINWMTRYEISQAIPPAYSEYLGKYMIVAALAGKRE